MNTLGVCPECSHRWTSHFTVLRLATKYGCQGSETKPRETVAAGRCSCIEMPPRINCADCIILGKRCATCRAKEAA